MQGTWVGSLVWDLDPCAISKRSWVLQLRPSIAKETNIKNSNEKHDKFRVISSPNPLSFHPTKVQIHAEHMRFLLPFIIPSKTTLNCAYGCWAEGWREGIVREFGMDMCTFLYLKWVTNKDLLYSAGNSAQSYVAAWMRGGFGGTWIHVYAWLSPFTVHLKLSQHC